MLTSGRRDLKNIGAYRCHDEPIRIVSGELFEPTVHYEAPSADSVQKEMDSFITWFNASAPTSEQPLSALLRSGIAQIYFESIYPFEDGNGRIDRAISEKALMDAITTCSFNPNTANTNSPICAEPLSFACKREAHIGYNVLLLDKVFTADGGVEYFFCQDKENAMNLVKLVVLCLLVSNNSISAQIENCDNVTEFNGKGVFLFEAIKKS